MQAVSRGLRLAASTSRTGEARRVLAPAVQWNQRRNWGDNFLRNINPLAVFRPLVRKSASQEDREAAKRRATQEGRASLFEDVPLEPTDPYSGDAALDTQARLYGGPREKHTHHKYSTSNFRISRRKLNDLGNQISGKPIDWAILQMGFSQKRASKRIKNMLKVARKHASDYKGLDTSKLVVAEAWVTKGKYLKRLEIKGRSRMGIRVHPRAKMNVVLKEGKTWEEQQKERRSKLLKRVISAGVRREDVPIRRTGGPMWAW